MRRKLLAGVAALAFLLPSLALAQTNDGLKQQTVRGSTGTAYDYNGDWQALFDQAGIAPGPFNGRMLAWINQQLSANYTDLTSALDAFAISQGAPNWSSLGSFTIGGQVFNPPCIPTGNPPTPTCGPNGSTFMGYSHAAPSGVINGGLLVQSGTGATGGQTAWLTNEDGTAAHNPLSWTLFGQFTYDASASQQGGSSTTHALFLAANCGGASCSTVKYTGIRYIAVTNPYQTNAQAYQSNELTLQGWGGATAVGNTLYQAPANNNYWSPAAPLTGTTGGCLDSTVCHTGIVLTPGVTYTYFETQYGLEAANVSAGIAGLVAISVVDSNGNHAPGSPLITTADNLCQPIASCGAKGFYNVTSQTVYNSAASLGPLIATIGTSNTITTANEQGTHGPFANWGMVYGIMPNTAGVPTLSVLQDLATGKVDPAAWATAAADYNGTLHSLYRLNDVGTWADSGPNGYQPLIPVNASYQPTPASPIVPPKTLVIKDFGPGNVYSIDYGQSGAGAVGTINFAGTYSNALAGFTISGVQCQVLNSSGSAVSSWVNMTASAGAFSGSIGGITQGSGYTKQCRITNSPNYVVKAASPVSVGALIFVVGQSQMDVLKGPQTAVTAGSGSNLIPAQPFSAVTLTLNDLSSTSGSSVSNYGTGSVGINTADVNDSQGSDLVGGYSNFQPIGDGYVAFVNNLELTSAIAGMPVEVVTLTKSGQAVDSFIFDYFPQTQQFAAGTSYSGQALAFSTSPVPNANLVAAYFKTVKEGSVVLTDDGGHVLATDIPPVPYHFNATCSWTSGQTVLTCKSATGLQTVLSGGSTVFVNTKAGLAAGTTVTSTSGAMPTITVNTNVATTVTESNVVVEFTTYGSLYPAAGSPVTLTSGSVNYTGDTFSATFSSAPSGHLNVAWTSLQDTQAGSYGQQLPYVGYGTTGDFTNLTSGYLTQMLAAVDSRATAVVFSQCTSNSGEVSSITGSGAAGLTSMNSKWDWFFSHTMAKWPRWDVNTPIVTIGYQRDTGGTFTQTVPIAAGCAYFLQQYPTHIVTPGLTPPHIYSGGDYPDLTVQQGPGGLFQSPHAVYGPVGGAREGKRWAAAVGYALAGQNLPAATISNVAFKGCPGACDYTKIDITFSVPAALSGSSLATCGSALSTLGAALPPQGAKNGGTNNCVVTTWNTGDVNKTVKGFRIGSSNTVMYNDYGLDHGTFTSLVPNGALNAVTNTPGVNGPAGINDPSYTFHCTLISATVVECQNMGTWNWANFAQVYVSYEAEGPAVSSGHVTGLSFTPGSGQTPGTYSITAAGGSCTTEPAVAVHVSAGGVIDDAFINTGGGFGTVGNNCQTTPTVTVTGTGGTPGTVTLTGGFGASSGMGLGFDLIDVGELLYTNDGSTAYQGTNFEPGLPVKRCLTPQLVGGGSVTC